MGAAEVVGSRGIRPGIAAAAAVVVVGGCNRLHRDPLPAWEAKPSPVPIGANPDPASALRPTEARLAGEFAGVLQAEDKTDVLGTIVVDGRFSARYVSLHAGWSATWMDLHVMPDGKVAGNVR